MGYSQIVENNRIVLYSIAATLTISGVFFMLKNKTPVEGKASVKSKKKKKKEEKVEKGEKGKGNVVEKTLASTDSEEIKQIGNDHYRAERFEEAIEAYTRAIELEKDHRYYNNRAAAYIALKKYDEAIADTTAALEIDVNYSKAFSRRGAAHEAKKEYFEALVDFTATSVLTGFTDQQALNAVERVLEILSNEKIEKRQQKVKEPSASFIYTYLSAFRKLDLPKEIKNAKEGGDLLVKQAFDELQLATTESYKKARDLFTQATESTSRKDIAWNMVGTFHFLHSSIDESMKAFDKSIEANPKYVQSYVKRASVFLEQGNFDAAMDDFKTAETIDPNFADIYYHRAQVSFLRQMYSTACNDYETSIKKDPDFLYSYVQLAVAQYKNGRLSNALNTFRKIIRKWKDSPDAYNYYGEIFVDQNQADEAIEQFNIAIEKGNILRQTQPKASVSVMPYINKALAMVSSGKDVTAACALVDEALRIDPDCEIAIATNAQLQLQMGKLEEATKSFERTADIARSLEELKAAVKYGEATRAQWELTRQFPSFKDKLRV